jgi:hypothetical protein
MMRWRSSSYKQKAEVHDGLRNELQSKGFYQVTGSLTIRVAFGGGWHPYRHRDGGALGRVQQMIYVFENLSQAIRQIVEYGAPLLCHSQSLSMRAGK